MRRPLAHLHEPMCGENGAGSAESAVDMTGPAAPTAVSRREQAA
jgi:hypothetical protein